MSAQEKLGRDVESERDLFVAPLPRPENVSGLLALPSPYFLCLLAWNADETSDDEILAFVRGLLSAGCVYICCWGPGCERVHDLFDEAYLERSPEGPVAMSTWHVDEPLAEAVRFVLYYAFPDDTFADGCRSTVGITIGSATWAAEVRAGFEEKVSAGL
jgi:hypothetical protein